MELFGLLLHSTKLSALAVPSRLPAHQRIHPCPCSTPIPLSLCDYFFLDRQLPSLRSWGSLGAILAGAAGYVLFDSSFQVQAYLWLGLW
jgi:hypothetical protein